MRLLKGLSTGPSLDPSRFVQLPGMEISRSRTLVLSISPRIKAARASAAASRFNRSTGISGWLRLVSTDQLAYPGGSLPSHRNLQLQAFVVVTGSAPSHSGVTRQTSAPAPLPGASSQAM